MKGCVVALVAFAMVVMIAIAAIRVVSKFIEIVP